MWPPKQAALWVLSVCVVVSMHPVWAPNLKTKKAQKKKQICVNVPQCISNWCANYWPKNVSGQADSSIMSTRTWHFF